MYPSPYLFGVGYRFVTPSPITSHFHTGEVIGCSLCRCRCQRLPYHRGELPPVWIFSSSSKERCYCSLSVAPVWVLLSVWIVSTILKKKVVPYRLRYPTLPHRLGVSYFATPLACYPYRGIRLPLSLTLPGVRLRASVSGCLVTPPHRCQFLLL